MSGEEAVLDPHLIVHFRASGMQLNGVENGVYTYQVDYYPVQYEFTHTLRLQNLLITDLRGMVSDYPHAQFRFLGPPEIWCPTESVFSGLDYNNDVSTHPDLYCNVRGDDMVDNRNFAQSSKMCSHTECAENVLSRENAPENDRAEPEDTCIKYSVNLPPETGCETDLKTELEPNNMNNFQRTVKILNVTEDPEEDTKSLVMKLILKSRRFLLKDKDILHCNRVGCENKYLPRPIIVTFNTKHTCNKVLQRFSYDDLQIVRIDTESKAKSELEEEDTGGRRENVSENNSERQLQESENTLVMCTLPSVTDDSINNNDTHQGENRSVEFRNIFPSAGNLGVGIELALDSNGSRSANALYEKSLRILHVTEDPGEDLKQLVIKLVSDSRGVILQSKNILQCKRIGKRRNHRPRAIVVTLTSRKICKTILRSPKIYDLPILQELSPEINSLRLQANALFGSENVRLRGWNEILVKLQDESTVKFKSESELYEFIANSSREYAVIVNSPENPNRMTGDFTL